jgi:hypothetical protein
MRLMSYEGPAFPVLRRLSQEDGEFKASLGYIVRHCLLKKNTDLQGWPLAGIWGIFLSSLSAQWALAACINNSFNPKHLLSNQEPGNLIQAGGACPELKLGVLSV